MSASTDHTTYHPIDPDQPSSPPTRSDPTHLSGRAPVADPSIGGGADAGGPAAPPPVAAGPPAPRRGPVVVSAVIAATIATATTLGVSAWTASPAPEPGTATTSSTEATSVAADGNTVGEVSTAVSPSVASVSASGVGGPQPGAGAATGSAVIVRADGYLATNHHVIDGADDVGVTLADGTQHDAEVVGSDPTSDLAVLRIEATDLPAATLADTAPEVGDTAIAIGSPFGLDGSVTSGIVSALERTLAGENATLTGLIQTDAAINPGNSGGPLVDGAGEILGINTAIYSASGTNGGVGFAVPASTLEAVVEQLITDGEVVWPVLGVLGQDLDAAVADAYDLDVERGALIGEVAGDSGAADAGLRGGDVVTGLDDAEITSMSDLAAGIRRYEVGDTVTVTFVRDGSERTTEVTLTAGD